MPWGVFSMSGYINILAVFCPVVVPTSDFCLDFWCKCLDKNHKTRCDRVFWRLNEEVFVQIYLETTRKKFAMWFLLWIDTCLEGYPKYQLSMMHRWKGVCEFFVGVCRFFVTKSAISEKLQFARFYEKSALMDFCMDDWQQDWQCSWTMYDEADFGCYASEGKPWLTW